MTPSLPEIEEADLMLAEAAKMDLALARDLHARALAAEDNMEAATLARAYQGVTRSMRQALALLAKQKADRARAAREARPRRNEARIAARREVVREAVRRVMFTETDEDEHDDRWDWIEARLDIDALPDTFADQPLDDQIVEICAEMGVDREAAARWRDTPEIEYDLDIHGDPDAPGDPDRPVFGWTGGQPRQPAAVDSG